MSAIYYVDTIHLNVGVGDCSIVCKLQHVAGVNAKPILISAVLIDGGYQSAAAVIKQCLTVQIPNRYDVTAMGGKVILTAVVITHWDGDHYGGVMNLIRTDLMEQSKGMTKDEIKSLRCSFFSQSSITSDLVFTTLYVPYWEVAADEVLKSTPLDRLRKNTVEPWPGVGDTLDFKLLKPESGYKDSWVTGLCRLRSSSEQNLGKNLFVGRGPELDKDLTSPFKLATELTKTINPDTKAPALGLNEPGLVCVGCNLDGVWNTPKMSVITKDIIEKENLARASPSSAQKSNLQVTEDGPSHNSMKIVNIKTGTSPSENTNAASISCVILWAARQGHVSHYLAGDLYWEQEQPLISWISLSGEDIGAIKLSHHGSESSSPTAVFSTLKPNSVIASAGTSHGHPRWEMILWLDLWARTKQGGERGHFFAPMIYPYWLLDGNGVYPPFVDVLDISIKNSYPAKGSGAAAKAIAAFQEAINDMSKACDITKPFYFHPQQSGDQIYAARNYIYNYVGNLWQHLCSIDQRYSSYGLSREPKNVISYWCVRARLDDTTDGNPDGFATWRTVDYDFADLAETPGVREYHTATLTVRAVHRMTRAGYAQAGTTVIKGLDTSRKAILEAIESDNNVAHATEGSPDELKSNDNASSSSIDAERFVALGASEVRRDILRDVDPPVDPPPVITPTSLPPDGYFICASSTLVVTAANTLVLSSTDTGAKGALNQFLDGLTSGVLSITAAPDLTGKPVQDQNSDFPDDLFLWHSAVLNTSTIIVRGVPGSITPVTAFEIRITKPWKMQFTTEAFTSSPPFSPLPDMPFGFYPQTLLLYLGLDLASANTTLKDTTLADVLSFISLDAGILQTLSSGLSLMLDEAAGSRNTMWFASSPDYNSIVRLQFQLSDEKLFTDFVKSLSSTMSVSNLRLIVRKNITRLEREDGFEARQNPELMLTLTLAPPDGLTAMDAALIFDNKVITLVIEPQDGSLEQMLGWLAFLTPGTNADDVKKVKDWIAAVSDKLPKVREMRIAIGNNQIQSFFLDLELDVDFGKSADSTGKVAFFFTYQYTASPSQHKVTGSLWTPYYPLQLDQMDQRLLPDFELYKQIDKPSDPDYQDYLWASNIFPGYSPTNYPKELDLKIALLNFSLSSTQLTFAGTMLGSSSNLSPGDVSHFVLEMVSISASWTFEVGGSGGSPAIFNVGLSTIIVLEAANPDDNARMDLTVEYNTAVWNLSGTIDHLKMSALASLFPGTDGSTAMEILDHFQIQFFDIDYAYDPSGTGSTFSVDATLLLDIFALDFAFNWTKSPASWDIHAILTLAPTVHTTIKSVLRAALKDPTIADLIPNFADFSIDGGSSGVELIVKKGTNAADSSEAVVFALSLLIKGTGEEPDIRISFVQIKQLSGAATPGTTPSIKRIARVSVNSIPWPALPNIPMVGSLKQPFNEIDYAWVHDDGKGDASTLGLTRADIACINDAVKSDDPSLVVQVKDIIAPAKAKPTDILLVPGSHFLVIADDPTLTGGTGVVLDYACQSSDDTKPSTVSHFVMRDAAVAPEVLVQTPNEPSGETAMASHTNTQGPLSISNVGLRYSNGVLSVLFDATVKLGPIEFSLLGFGIGVDLSSFNLRSLFTSAPTLSLNGLAAEYNEPPLQVAGIFENLSSPGIVKYVGGISVDFEPYSFLAVGAYGEITKDGHTYKSVFVFAKLDGPLVELEFAEISGICGGFGYNSYLRYPSLAEIYSFPFVDNPSGSSTSDPLALLESLTSNGPSNPNKGWVSDQEGSIWLAAGLKVTAFQTLSINAVIVLEFNPYVSLGIFADAVASLPPPEEGKSPFYILYVELGIAATLDFHGGTFRVEASLSPNSFVLNPLCHLSGGFALCYWFAGSPYDGDWVFTVGGYHSAFKPPDHYPTPDRLQIYWGLGGGLSITGQAYLAVTPKVCMVGGLLSAVLDAGPLGASFSAHADLLINYQPFHFNGTAGVEIGVLFTLDLFICTLYISVDISAELTMYGPPFGGDVWVDFWVFGFSIHFGDDEQDAPILDLPGFQTLLEQQQQQDGTPPQPTAHVYAVEKGRYVVNKSTDNTDSPPGAPWTVKSQGLSFRVQSRFAIETSSCNGAAGVQTPNAIYAKPMHLLADKDPKKDQHITSMMSVTIAQKVDGKDVNTLPFNATAVVKKVPQALWAAYTTGEDPLQSGNHISTLMDGTTDLTVDLIMSITFSAPPPVLSHDLILPFNAQDAMAQDVFTEEDHANGLNPLILPEPVYTSTAWNPAPHPPVPDTDEKLWADAKTAWENPDLLVEGQGGKIWGLKDVVGMWGSAMQWKDLPDADTPSVLVDGLEGYYMSAPFIGVD